jgi:NMD protein affecting ribosome stability and mRNA decay
MSARILHRHFEVIHLSDLAEQPNEGNVNMLRRSRTHRHHEVTTHVIRQRAGVPYEVEQRVCRDCRTVIAERALRRAAA